MRPLECLWTQPEKSSVPLANELLHLETSCFEEGWHEFYQFLTLNLYIVWSWENLRQISCILSSSLKKWMTVGQRRSSWSDSLKLVHVKLICRIGKSHFHFSEFTCFMKEARLECLNILGKACFASSSGLRISTRVPSTLHWSKWGYSSN